VKLSRLRSGERLALVSAVGLIVLLGLNWYVLSTPDARIGAHESGIRALGWFAELIVLLAALLALGLVFATVTERATAIPLVLAVATTLAGILAVLTILVRLIAQPTLGVDASSADVDVALPAYLGLLCAAGIAGGGWLAMADERTDSADSRERTEDVLRVRGAPRPVPPGSAEPS
jgi:hypothetical protein